MTRITSIFCIAVLCAFGLSACATSNVDGSGVGAVSSKQHLKKKNKRVASKSCRSLRRELRRLESKRQAGSKAYERALNAYIARDCYSGQS